MQIAIVLYPGLTTLDALGPFEILRFIPESEVRFVSHARGPVPTDSNVLVLGATHSFEEVSAPDIVLVPGSSTDTMTAMADDRLIAWLQKVHPKTRLTLSVCSGALILAAAGLLQGRPATTHWMVQEILQDFGASPQPDQRIVKTGKIYTAAGVSAGLDLGLEVVAEICGREGAEIIQLLIEYDPRPPFDAGHISKASETVIAAARVEMARLMNH